MTSNASNAKNTTPATYVRETTRVVRRTKTREVESRAYTVYRFTDATHANAVASRMYDRAAGSGATIHQLLKDAARDPRGYLHACEAGKALQDAQLRELGSVPTLAHVTRLLESWNGRGYIAVGDTIVTLADASTPQPSTMTRKGRATVESVEPELVDVAYNAREDARLARARMRELRSPVERKQLAS